MAIQQDNAVATIKSGIARGDFPVGSYLPSAMMFANQTRFSTHAVQRAYRILSDQGILHSVKRKGTRVVMAPPAGRVLLLLSADPDTNVLLQEPVAQAFIKAGFEVTFQPYIFHEGAGYERQRLLAGGDAAQRVLVSLGQDKMPATARDEWEVFAARFAARVSFQFEQTPLLSNSMTILPDAVAAAREVATHMTALGHRRIGVVAGAVENDGTAADRRAAALSEFLDLLGAECHRYYYGQHAGAGVLPFIRERHCTAWWTITDHQALDHILQFQAAGINVPNTLSVIGSNDTPLAKSGSLRLTSLSLNPTAVADAMVAAVRQCLNGEELSCMRVVRPTLITRGSTAACRRTDN